MTVIINFGSTENMDMQIIPEVIYTNTINKETENIQNYFILHPILMYSFVGYNGQLKLANQLSSNKKCGCFYNITWKTHYDFINNTKETTLSFSQQVEEYRYMIKFWTPSPKMSYMQYLSEIALRMVLDISQYMSYIGNNLEPCFIYQKKYYKNNFNSVRAFRIYIFKYFSKINKKHIYYSN
jgi:hypothetical protein